MPQVVPGKCPAGLSLVACAVCSATGATALVKLGAPAPDELGFAKSLKVVEIGGSQARAPHVFFSYTSAARVLQHAPDQPRCMPPECAAVVGGRPGTLIPKDLVGHQQGLKKLVGDGLGWAEHVGCDGGAVPDEACACGGGGSQYLLPACTILSLMRARRWWCWSRRRVFSALTILSLMRAQVVVLEQEAGAGAVASVVLRGSTAQLLDDLERALDDGVNTYKARPAHATPS